MQTRNIVLLCLKMPHKVIYCNKIILRIIWLWYLELNNQTDITIPKKQLFREAFENGLLEDPDSWFKYHEARNKTSHMYSQEASDLVYGLSDDFIKDVKKLLHNLVITNGK